MVNSLLEGLRDGDTVEELQARLQALPTDLEELFRKILHRLNPFYFKQSCEVFLLHRAACLPITLLDLALAKEGCEKALRAPIRPFTAPELEYYSENMRRFLSSRCKGLLEAPDVGVEKQDANAQYLHRTVRDFFQQASVLDYIESGTIESFDPILQLSAAYLARIKSILPQKKLSMVQDFWTAFSKGVHNAKQIRSSETQIMFLEELDKTSTQLWMQRTSTRSGNMTWLEVTFQQTIPEHALFKSIPRGSSHEADSKFWGNTQYLVTVIVLPGLFKTVPRCHLSSFFDLAVQFNFHRYVIHRLDNEIALTHTSNSQTLYDFCNKNDYNEIKEYLIKRKAPGSRQQSYRNDHKPGSISRRWYKRFSKLKSPDKT